MSSEQVATLMVGVRLVKGDREVEIIKINAGLKSGKVYEVWAYEAKHDKTVVLPAISLPSWEIKAAKGYKRPKFVD